MALALRDFWTTLIRLRLLDPVSAKRLAQTAHARLPGNDSENPVELARFLVTQKVLTLFQAKRVLANRAGELRYGEYLVLERVGEVPLTRWLRAKHLPSDTPSLIYPCSTEIDAENFIDPAWLRPHAAVAADGLQAIEMIQLAGGQQDDAAWRGLVASPLPEGESLDRWLDRSGPMDAGSTAVLGKVLAGALQAMHAAGLHHGGVRPQRVWIGNDASVYLLRCAGGPPIYPRDPIPAAYDWFDDDERAADYASPQWLSGDSQASPADDVYSLGALLYQCLTGGWIRPGAVPDDLAEAAGAGAAGDPLLRVLAAAVAADSQKRFADMGSFTRALDTAESLLSASPTEPEASATAVQPRPQSEPEASATAPKQKPQPETKASATAMPSPPPPSTPKPTPTAAQSAPAKRHRKAAPTPSKPKPAVTEPKIAAVASPSLPPVDSLPPADSPPPRSRRKRKRRNEIGPILVASSSVALLLILLAVLVRFTRSDPPPRPRPTPRPVSDIAARPAPAAPTAADSTRDAAADGGFEIVSDDQLLWVPPWPADASPASLELATPGAQMIIALRPSRLLASESPIDWLSWFGPELEPAVQRLGQRAGIAAEQIDQLVISLVAGQDGFPEASFAVRPSEPVELQQLRSRWDAGPSRTPDGQTIFAGDEPDSDAYFIAGDDFGDSTAVSAFAFGPLEHMKWVADGGGGPIPLARPMQAAWNRTSGKAEATILVSPNFLFADGRKLLQGAAPRAIDPLRQLLIPDVSAAAITVSTDESMYAEIRLVPGGGVSPGGLLRSLQDRIEQLPSSSESFLIDSDIDPSWRALAIRLPQYYRAVKDQSRFGISDALPTMNVYLPSEAAPQIGLASLLALATPAGTTRVAAAAPAAGGEPMSIDQLLETKLSVSFEQESLEAAVGMIADELVGSLPEGAAKPQITILGGDLEKSGITQNQQIRDFHLRDSPLRQHLTELVLGANPDKTATGPADEKQSLIWIVDPESTPQSPGLLITTRPEAQAKNYPLPREFTGN